MEPIKFIPLKREKKKCIFVLPIDQIKLLDDAANAIGIDRSAFLTICLDSFAELIQSFVVGWRTGTKFYQEKIAEEKLTLEKRRERGRPRVRSMG